MNEGACNETGYQALMFGDTEEATFICRILSLKVRSQQLSCQKPHEGIHGAWREALGPLERAPSQCWCQSMSTATPSVSLSLHTLHRHHLLPSQDAKPMRLLV